MTQWDAIIIGSGLGGLAAATVLARAGKRVLVVERLANFGGAATLYRHGRMTMEASLHEISEEDVAPPHGVLHRLGVSEGLELLRPEEFYEVRSAHFEPLSIPHGIDVMTQALVGALPRAEPAIRRYGRALQRLHRAVSQAEDVASGGAGAAARFVFSGGLFEILSRVRLSVAEAMQRSSFVTRKPLSSRSARPCCILTIRPAKRPSLPSPRS